MGKKRANAMVDGYEQSAAAREETAAPGETSDADAKRIIDNVVNGAGAEYDATMAKVGDGLAKARAARKAGARDPDAPRAVYLVIGLSKDGNTANLLGQHKTKRRAMSWVKDNSGLLRMVCDGTRIFRAKEVRE